MLQVACRLRVVGVRSKGLRIGTGHKFQHILTSLLRTLVVLLLLLHIVCCSWILICKVGSGRDCEAYVDALREVRRNYSRSEWEAEWAELQTAREGGERQRVTRRFAPRAAPRFAPCFPSLVVSAC